MKRALGVCYYPEHWTSEIWREDARRMSEAGITWVRIGEFAWSRLEPAPDDLRFEWLDEAIAILGGAGLKVVLGTPTATPPRWMVDRQPDMLAVDVQGRPRGFGSRRHYDFSHEGYRAECARIVGLLATRYGKNPHVAAWQTDNEYGCHDTVHSYSHAALAAFRHWLARRYGTVSALNESWGNVFWSMEYRSFDEISLPNLTVTEPNPSHSLDFRRFSSDQVVTFNRLQAEIIHRYSDAPVAHNYMGKVTEFDHYAVGADLEIASWDSYPLGFLEDRVQADPAYKRRFARQGDCDFQAFHHDLYRAVGRGHWWVMEQQPGPVNWAPYNPAPLEGMVRLWAWEAFAHGAEVVSYFRWRQAPMAQEQMHAGLLRPDSAETPALPEVRRVAAEIGHAPEVSPAQAPVALIYDYDAEWAWTVQPHGRGLEYFWLVFDFYRALRALGLSIDIVPPDTADFSSYRMVLAPGLMHLAPSLKQSLGKASGKIVLGPRSGARDTSMRIPNPLPPSIEGFDVTVTHVESLRPNMPVALAKGGAFQGYREFLEGEVEVSERATDGSAAVVSQGKLTYLAGWPDQTAARRIFGDLARAAGLETRDLPDGLRCRDTATERFWFNYDSQPHQIDGVMVPAAGFVRLVR